MVPIVFLENLPGFISLVHRLPFRITDQRQRTKSRFFFFSGEIGLWAWQLIIID
jgi:hypothetical protein